MLKLEEVFIDNYLEAKIERESILKTYLSNYNSLQKEIDRIRFTSVLGNRMMHCEELVKHHDSIIDYHLSNLKEQISSYIGIKTEQFADPPFILAPVNEEAFDSSLAGQTDLLMAYLHLFITALKKGFVDGSILDIMKGQYQKIQQIVGVDPAQKEPTFDDLQLLITESGQSHNTYIRGHVLQRILTRIGDKSYQENLKLTPRSKVERNYSVQIPSLINKIAKNISKKGTSSYHPETIEIYLNQYQKNPLMSRSNRIKKCISIVEDETIRTEFTDKCGASTLKRWEDKLERSLKDIKRFA